LLDYDFLKKYNDIGGGHISLSIDAIGSRHDELRGFAGAFKNIERVLALFENNNFSNLVLKINVTLTNDNLDHAIEVVELARKSGAVMFIQPYDTYDYGNRELEIKEKKYPLWVKKENYGKLKKLIDDLVVFKNKYPQVVLNDVAHIKSMFGYFTDPNFFYKCHIGIDQVVINPFGEISFCKFGKAWDLREKSLTEFVKSDKRKAVVAATLKCKEGCLLGCMFRPSFSELFKNGFKQFLKLAKK